ncbi:hypothetical protein E2C01_001209 [Portunus trituberculatus]|uniref:Secreted protein n=1 Tax=Portunus trituberculatus TaxID=210409 RepID=A0A5B7CGK7_PORTR|nr:hypothetical protein [Portunus trituberculatus]
MLRSSPVLLAVQIITASGSLTNSETRVPEACDRQASLITTSGIMTDKGVTIERSPSGLGIGGVVFSPHLASSGGTAWDQQQQQQQNALITKLAATPPNRLNRNTDSLEKERRNRKLDDKSSVAEDGRFKWLQCVQCLKK